MHLYKLIASRNILLLCVPLLIRKAVDKLQCYGCSNSNDKILRLELVLTYTLLATYCPINTLYFLYQRSKGLRTKTKIFTILFIKIKN